MQLGEMLPWARKYQTKRSGIIHLGTTVLEGWGPLCTAKTVVGELVPTNTTVTCKDCLKIMERRVN